MKKSLTLFLLCVSFLLNADAQNVSPEKAFQNKNYKRAIQGFENKLVVQPDNYESQFYLGLSYLNSFPDISKSVNCFQKLQESKENNLEHIFYLGKAYHLNYKFDEAIETYSKYIEISKDTSLIKVAQRQVEMCYNAKVLVAKPVNVILKNLGDTINSESDDYNAFVEQTESVLVFTSRREKKNKSEKIEDNGKYTSDIFMSYYEEGAWQKVKSQSNISTPVNEEVAGLSADGTLMFYNTNARGYNGDMIVSKRKKGSFSEPVWIEKTINTNAIESSGCVTHNRQNFYYASERDEGAGLFDIYWSKRLPDVNWAKPMLLDINTAYNEMFPQVSPDEKTLYFASEGHNSMGGYDLFKVEWDGIKREWGPVENLGYPINTP
jgi:tetratricopeptide (TPR) repeat protein